MEREKTKFSVEKIVNLIGVFFSIVVFILIGYFFIAQVTYPDERDHLSTDCKVFEPQWYRVMENGEKVALQITPPDRIPAEYGEVVTLSTTLPNDIYNCETICFRVIWQDVDIYINGERRVHYTTKDSRPFGKNSAMRYLFVELEEDDAGKELLYQFSSKSKYAGDIRTSYIGDRTSIWLHYISETGVRNIVSIILFLMSFLCIVVCAVLKFVYKRNLDLNALAWTLFFCALWMISESDFRQLIFPNISVVSNYAYWSLMLIPIPLMIYINEIQKRRYQKVFVIPLVYGSLLLIIGTLLQICNIVQFVEQLPFIHGGVIVAIVIIIVTITIDVFNRKISQYLAVGIGIYGMMLSAIGEMILYYNRSNTSLGTVLSVGLTFLLFTAIVKTGQDLFETEKKKQQAIMATKAQAQFLANMSHEIRTPINAVIGMNEMILRENENETIQKYAHNIHSSSNMLLGLVNDVLDFSKIESGQLDLVEGNYHLASLIEDEMQLLCARATQKDLEIHLEADAELPSRLLGDELRIKQIVMNLLSNAVKYTKEGSVTLKVYFEKHEQDTIMLSFSVIDTGIGIKKEDVSQLFDSFKRLELGKNRNIEGTGLGLNIAKQLVDLMQGTIVVDTVYGKGSTFTVSIPQKVLDKQPIGNLEESLEKYRKEKGVSSTLFTAPDAFVLAVDDNSMNLSVIQGLLKRTKIQLDCVTSGKECLEYASKKRYDIIFIDHMMPEMDGIETLNRLRQDSLGMNQHTIAIALTANAIAGCREMYLEHGFNDYFSKPIQADKLDELLMKYIPSELIHKVNPNRTVANSNEQVPQEQTESVPESELLTIDRTVGVSYCGNSDELYDEILQMFYEQCPELLKELDSYFQSENWEQYAILAHALKGNTLNIGAMNISKLCLEHEMAGKEENVEYIKNNYSTFVEYLNELLSVISKSIKN